jgi:hypothetical protein
MGFEKIPKEKWDQLSQEDKDYHTLEFKKSVEKRQRLTIISTRIIAIIFIIGLFYMGYSQLQQARIYDYKLKQYGPYGFCALCGEYNFKRCECEYTTVQGEINLSFIGKQLADYNAQQCKPKETFSGIDTESLNGLFFKNENNSK